MMSWQRRKKSGICRNQGVGPKSVRERTETDLDRIEHPFIRHDHLRKPRISFHLRALSPLSFPRSAQRRRKESLRRSQRRGRRRRRI